MVTSLQHSAGSVRPQMWRGEPITVLLVDDARVFADAASKHLEHEDGAIETRIATSGEDALRILAAEDVDCVVSDYQMPDMDGLALYDEIAQDHPDIAFILLTGNGDESLASRAVHAGVDDYVPKDVSPNPFVGLAQRVRASLQRQRRDAPYREVWQDVPVGLSVHDPETGTFLDANERACQILGYAQADLLDGATAWTESPDEPDLAWQLRDLVRGSDGGGYEAVEWGQETDDGRRRWVEASIQPAPVGGRERIVACLRDVTERHEREEVIRSIYEIIADPVEDFEAKVSELMRLGRRVLGTGFATLSRIEGEDYVFEHVQSPNDEIQPGDVVSIHQTLCEQTVIHKGRLVVDDSLEARNQTRGKALELSCYIGVPVAAGGAVNGTFCFYDVEPRQQPFSAWEVSLVDLMGNWISGELERIEVREELERENRRLDDFASMVSHDLKGPLAVASGHVRLLRDEIDHESLDHALDALDRSSEIVEDVLTWARRGRAIDDPDPVSIEDAAHAAWKLIDHDEAQLTVETQQTIWADEGRLGQLLENLFRNAVEHAGPRVSITVGSLDRGFFVEDDGPGFPSSEEETLLEVGFTTAEDGTGFGLAIVDQIADAHGWTLQTTTSSTGGARIEILGVAPVIPDRVS